MACSPDASIRVFVFCAKREYRSWSELLNADASIRAMVQLGASIFNVSD